jgi:hypothetical protein
MATLTRRAFLVVASLFAPVARLGAFAQRPPAPVSIDEFLRLSRRLVGRTRLDEQAAAIYLDAMLAVPANVPLLAQLARGPVGARALTPAHTALESTLIEWWYTGIYTVNGERRLATHTGALLWDALGMPAPGTCTSTFGAWSRPPRASL